MTRRRGGIALLTMIAAAIVGCVAYVSGSSSSGSTSTSTSGSAEIRDPRRDSPPPTISPTPTVSPLPSAAPPPPSSRPQFLLVGFDTTPLNPERGTEQMWVNINAGRRDDEAPRAFTLFIGTGGMTFDPDRRRLAADELPLRGVLPRNAYVFHYARTRHDVDVTVENIRRLAERGVEIGAHTVRHLHGREFSRERWDFELDDHRRILDLLGLDQPVGFRAPFLETNDDLYDSLRAHGYRYDCSRTQNGHQWPTRRADGLWVFSVPTIHIPGREGPVLLYDLNLDTRLHAAAVAAGIHGEEAIHEWMDATFEDVVERALMQRYRGSRAPFLVSGHGGFQRPIARLMRHVCGLPDMRCTTFSRATDYLDAHPELAGVE